MRIETPEPRYKLTMIPETPADFKQVLEELCDEWYGCYFTIDDGPTIYGIDVRDGGYIIAECVERADYWREHFKTPEKMLAECTHINGRPLSGYLGRMKFHPECDCA